MRRPLKPRAASAAAVAALLLAALLATLLSACATTGVGRQSMAVVNGEPLSEGEVGRALNRVHAGGMQQPGGQVDMADFLQRAVDDKLMLQDARKMGLFERADVTEAMRAYLVRESVGRLYEAEVGRKVVVSEAELKEKFFAEYNEAGLLVFTAEDKDRAEAAAKRLREGATAAVVAADLGADELKETFMRQALVGEDFQPLFKMEPGSVLGPVARQGRFVVVKLVSHRPAADKDFPQYREVIERPIRKLREKDRSDVYLAELRAKYPAQVNEALYKELPGTREELAKASGKLADDTRVVARVGEEEFTLGNLAAELERALRYKARESDPEKIERNIIKAWIDERVVDAEALSRHYEASDQMLAKDLEGYAEELVLRVYTNQVVVPQVKIDDAATKAYYDAHQKDYLKPARLKLRQVTFKSAEEAAAALGELKAGADFAWLARTRSTDDLAEKSGQLGWVSEDRLSPKAAEAVEGLKAGELTGVVVMGKTFTILKVEEREEPQPIPLDQVRREVQADLYRAELEKSRVAVAAKLREGSQIQVSPDALVRLKGRCFPADSNESLTPKPHP